MSRKKQKRGIPRSMVKKIVPYSPCKGCTSGYKGVEKDTKDKILRKFDCRKTCPFSGYPNMYLTGQPREVS